MCCLARRPHALRLHLLLLRAPRQRLLQDLQAQGGRQRPQHREEQLLTFSPAWEDNESGFSISNSLTHVVLLD